MMQFRAVKDSLINNILGPAAAGRYRVIGYQQQVKAAEETVDNLRLVQVYYSSGNFPKSAGRLTGPVQHDIRFDIDLTVGKAAAGDLQVINNSESTQAEIAAAINDFQEGSALADAALDELCDIVYQVLMAAENLDLGLPTGTTANRWIDEIRKDPPERQGEYVMLTGSMPLTCRVEEIVQGVTGTPGETYDFNIGLPGDDVQKTGIKGKLGGE